MFDLAYPSAASGSLSFAIPFRVCLTLWLYLGSIFVPSLSFRSLPLSYRTRTCCISPRPVYADPHAPTSSTLSVYQFFLRPVLAHTHSSYPVPCPPPTQQHHESRSPFTAPYPSHTYWYSYNLAAGWRPHSLSPSYVQICTYVILFHLSSLLGIDIVQTLHFPANLTPAPYSLSLTLNL